MHKWTGLIPVGMKENQRQVQKAKYANGLDSFQWEWKKTKGKFKRLNTQMDWTHSSKNERKPKVSSKG